MSDDFQAGVRRFARTPTRHLDEGLEETTATPWVWLTPKRAVVGIVVLVLMVGLVLTVLRAWGVTAQSTGDAIQMSLLAVIGVVAGITAAHLRKKGSWQTALTAYRIAVWCLFLAFWGAIQFHQDVQREAFIQEVKDKTQKLVAEEKGK